MTAAEKPLKTDLSREFPAFFKAPAVPELVELPEMSYLALDGEGVPEQALSPAIGAVYPVVYTVKMKLKAQGRDFKVCPIEAQWWFIGDDGSEVPTIADVAPERWRWRLIMMVPDFVTAEDVEAAKAMQASRKNDPLIEKVQLVRLHEGLCVQVMHTGPYDAEAPTIGRMWDFIDAHGLEGAGRHHEVYLGDPRQTRPERLRTLIRQPVRRRSNLAPTA